MNFQIWEQCSLCSGWWWGRKGSDGESRISASVIIGAGKGEPNASLSGRPRGTASAANSLQPADFKRPKALSKVAIVTDLLFNSSNCPPKRHYPDNLQWNFSVIPDL